MAEKLSKSQGVPSYAQRYPGLDHRAAANGDLKNMAAKVSAAGGLPPHVSPETFQTVTIHLGTTECFDENRDKRWTTSIPKDELAAPIGLAFFDARTRVWNVRSTHPTSGTLNVTHALLPSFSKTTSEDQQVDYNHNAATSPIRQGTWIDHLPETPHVNFFKRTKWSATPLGNFDAWPRSLRFYTHLLISQPNPAAIYWGPDLTSIYNEALIPFIGNAHPILMGSALFDVMPELNEPIGSIFRQIESLRRGTEVIEYNLPMERNNYVEETWWRGNTCPLIQDDMNPGGFYLIWNEITRTIVGDRRTKLLNELVQLDPITVSTQAVWGHIGNVLQNNGHDVPMFLLYSADETERGDDCRLCLEGAGGFNEGHAAAPKEIRLGQANAGFGPSLRRARKTPLDWIALVHNADEFPSEVLDGIGWQGWGEPSRTIVVMPVTVVNKLVRGFLVLGLNPRKAFDAEHQQFISTLQRQLTSLMNSVTTAEDARHREAQLIKNLTVSERRIRTLAELVPMGLYDLRIDGSVTWANSHYWSLLGTEKPDNLKDFSWMPLVHDDELSSVRMNLTRCMTESVEVSGTIRLKRKWKPPQTPGVSQEPEEEFGWILYSCIPVQQENGGFSIMGCVTDVNHLKWAEKVSARSAEDEQRARQRQEEFIDIVSHELRNPLSAITQSADDIIHSLQDCRITKKADFIQKILESNMEAAESILLCSLHQRRIVDDVLTLSKLDSALITVVPSIFQPRSIINEATRMFQAEFISNDIELQISAENNDEDILDGVVGDSSRVMQVLVNLLTNAIKYTKSERRRRILIHQGSCRSPPATSRFASSFRWSTTSKKSRPDPTSSSEYGPQDQIYVYFAVRDTGQGLRSEEAVHIFDKFMQANRRTHVKYGGSGLGLYISRELVEMQCGKIGVGSEEGVGSIFAFYIKARKSLIQVQRRTSSIGTLERAATEEATNYKILLVEDNLLNAKVLAKQLRRHGCTVHVANHGGEAIDFILRLNGLRPEYCTTEQAPISVDLDCILMDWEMPILDGLSATRRLRQLESDGTVKGNHLIIGVTANARSEQRKTAIEAGMDAVVTKPFRAAELMTEISRLMLR